MLKVTAYCWICACRFISAQPSTTTVFDDAFALFNNQELLWYDNFIALEDKGLRVIARVFFVLC